jgi:AcrR family transcriptional regulator
MRRSRSTAGDRVLDAAVARIREQGISVGLDGISLEEAIAASGVSRATAYRRWPNRTEFLRAVLVRVVHEAHLEPEGPGEVDAIRGFIEAHRDVFGTDAGRRTIVVECLRISAEADFRRLATSREWRDYLALRATCGSLPTVELRATLTAELAAAERAFVTHRATVYSRLPRLLGYRLVPPLTDELGFEVMAGVMGALMTGFVVRSALDVQTRSFRVRAFGSSVESDWTTTTYGLAAALLAYLEPDPSVDWNPQRAAESLAMLPELEAAVEAIRNGGTRQRPG